MILKTLLNFFNMDNWESGQFAKTDESLRYDYEDNMNDEVNYCDKNNASLTETTERNTLSNSQVIEQPIIHTENILIQNESEKKKDEEIQAKIENDIEEETEEDSEEETKFMSDRLIIKGLDIYFIDVAREIVCCKGINKIPLMREYKLSEDTLNRC